MNSRCLQKRHSKVKVHPLDPYDVGSWPFLLVILESDYCLSCLLGWTQHRPLDCPWAET